MEKNAFSENPFLKSMLLNWAATLAVFAGLLLLQRTAVLDASIFRAVSLAALGFCAYKLTDEIVNWSNYRKYVKANNGRTPGREEFLDEQKASYSTGQALKIGLTALILFVLLMLQSLFGGVFGLSSGPKVTMEELAGRYEVTDIKGDQQMSPYLQLMEGIGVKLFLEIDMEGNASLGFGGASVRSFRFYPEEKQFKTVEDGVETDTGGYFTLKNGVLVMNGKIWLKKVA